MLFRSAIIAKEFTVENVARVALATAVWTKHKYEKPSIVIGHDCRFAGELFVETAVKVFLSQGIHVKMAKGFVSTPMISLAATQYNCGVGVIITASHNPPAYNGYKLKADFGGPLSPENVQEIEDMILDENSIDLDSISIQDAIADGRVEIVDIETRYVEHVKAHFDLDAIKNSGLKFVYDAMYGAGQNVMKRILPNITFLHCEHNPSFYGQAPEPISKNLQELEAFLKANPGYDCALSTDGDADRIGLHDGEGNFVDSHHIILLLLNYLVKHKKMTGEVVTAFSCTPRIEKLAMHYGLEHTTTRIGFKEIATIMVQRDVLLGGEESGGIAVKGHIPERDGI